jgi:hypothetical protein
MKLAVAAVLVLACALTPLAAEAAWPMGWWYGWYGYGAPFAPPTDYVPRPPYYALYPPVYYSPLRIARPYGDSPFAWYPGMSQRAMPAAPPAAALPPPPPQWIENPFVVRRPATSTLKPQSNADVVVVQQDRAQPVAWVENPYVRPASR